jgi:hypothetical protein
MVVGRIGEQPALADESKARRGARADGATTALPYPMDL